MQSIMKIVKKVKCFGEWIFTEKPTGRFEQRVLLTEYKIPVKQTKLYIYIYIYIKNIARYAHEEENCPNLWCIQRQAELLDELLTRQIYGSSF